MAEEVLRIENLQAWYGESHVLHGVNLAVNRGEVVTLLGRNGAGRTSTLKSQLAGIWEVPSASLMRQYTDVKLALPRAVTEGNAVLAKAATVSTALKKYDITLTVPPVPK